MLKRLYTISLILLFLVTARVSAAEKVLLDSDMVDLFDDGVAMMMLVQSPEVELVGITTMTGNNWAPACTASAIRQLEGLGVKNIPVIEGKTPTRITKRLLNIDRENKYFGRNYDTEYHGAGSFPKPVDWHSAYVDKYGAEPTLEPFKDNAVDFIIRTIKENPHEVTIAEIGPCTNLAAALKKAPEIASLVKKVVYMGGAFYTDAVEFPAAEFNIWVDPESAKVSMRANFPEQIVVPQDVCNKVHITKEEFMDLRSRIKSPLFLNLMDNHYLLGYFESGNAATFIWDVLVAAIVLDPSIITEEVTLPVDVNDTYSISYGQTLAYKGYGPEGSREARIILNVDEDKVHQMMRQVFDKL